MIYRYDYPEQFSGLEAPDFAKFSGNIVLWGAGKIGGIVAHILKQKGIRVLAFVDILAGKQGSEFCGLKIISPETFLLEYKNAELIITTIGRDDVVEFLEANTFSSYHDAWPLLLRFDFGDYSEQNQMYMTHMIGYYFRVVARAFNLADDYVMNHLRVMTTSRCTLRCKECNAFLPYVKNPQDDDWRAIVNDIQTLLDAVGKFEDVSFVGGEPLIHPDLAAMIGALAEESRIKKISVVSNGTILPTPSLIETMARDRRIVFLVSSYGKLSSRMPEIEKLLKGSGIAHEIIDYKTWYKASEIAPYQESHEALKKKFNCCMQAGGIVSWSGKLFVCMTLPFLLDAGAFPESADNFYDLRNSGIPREQLLDEARAYVERCNTGNYVDACRYCSGKSSSNFEHPVPVAEQIKGLPTLPNISACGRM